METGQPQRLPGCQVAVSLSVVLLYLYLSAMDEFPGVTVLNEEEKGNPSIAMNIDKCKE